MSRKKFLAINFIILFLLSILSINQLNATEPFKVGDSFTFTTLESDLIKINGTDYSVPYNNQFNGTKIYSVTGVGSNQVNLSYVSNNKNETTYVKIDQFLIYVWIIGLVYYGFKNTKPNNVNFENMTTNPNMAYPNTAKSDTFFPMFASGNLSYNQSFFNPNITTTTSVFPINSNFSYYQFHHD